MFKKNVGAIDMLIRLFVALALFYLGLADNPIITESSSKTALTLLGSIALLTGALRTCPLYSLIGVSTCTTAK